MARKQTTGRDADSSMYCNDWNDYFYRLDLENKANKAFASNSHNMERNACICYHVRAILFRSDYNLNITIMENLRQYINYANFAALICYIIGRVIGSSLLCWIGLGIMVLTSIYTIIHWKENEKLSNYIAVAFLVLVGLSIFGL